ncbi:MAG: rod shape-determining protein MreD [Ignavibacteria bacterium]
MNDRILKSVFYLFLILLFQLIVVEIISFNYIKPDVLLIGLIYFTLINGQIAGMISGFIFGLLMDILSGGVLGANAISKLIATFFAGFFSREDVNEREVISTGFFIVLLISSLIEKLVYIFVTSSVDFKYIILVYLNYGLVPTFVTMVFSLFLLFFTRKSEVR